MDTTRILLVRIINLIGGVVGVLLALRIILMLLGANSRAPIVSWIYSISGGLVAPFRGIFSDINLAAGSVLDVSALIAFAVYMILLSILIAVINSFVHAPLVDDHVHAH